jgi:TatA/E family protein of Tat protein translocase
MFDVGGGELLLIVLAILLLFGPKKIPEIAKMFAKGMQQFRKAQSQFQSQINEIKNEIDKSADFNIKEYIKTPDKSENQEIINKSEILDKPSDFAG